MISDGTFTAGVFSPLDHASNQARLLESQLTFTSSAATEDFFELAFDDFDDYNADSQDIKASSDNVEAKVETQNSAEEEEEEGRYAPPKQITPENANSAYMLA